MKKARALLLDLDGTLLDTAPDFLMAINRLRQDYRLPALPFSAIRPSVSDGTKGMLAVGFGIQPKDVNYETLKEQFLAYYQENLSTHTRPFPGILSLLAQWEKQGPWGIVTNKPECLTLPLLEQQGLMTRLSCVISGDSLPVRKPSPEPLLAAAQKIATEPEACIYVGDNRRDIEAGRAAKMRTIAASYGYIAADDNPVDWQADYIANYPDEIGLILDES